MDLAGVKRMIAMHKKELYGKFSIKEIRIFGSFARGEQKKGSDVDLLVDFEIVPGLFTIVRAEEFIGNLLGRKVDLVTFKSLKPLIAKQALKEAVVAWA